MGNIVEGIYYAYNKENYYEKGDVYEKMSLLQKDIYKTMDTYDELLRRNIDYHAKQNKNAEQNIENKFNNMESYNRISIDTLESDLITTETTVEELKKRIDELENKIHAVGNLFLPINKNENE